MKILISEKYNEKNKQSMPLLVNMFKFPPKIPSNMENKTQHNLGTKLKFGTEVR